MSLAFSMIMIFTSYVHVYMQRKCKICVLSAFVYFFRKILIILLVLILLLSDLKQVTNWVQECKSLSNVCFCSNDFILFNYMYIYCYFFSEWIPLRFLFLLYPLSWCWMDTKPRVSFSSFHSYLSNIIMWHILCFQDIVTILM